MAEDRIQVGTSTDFLETHSFNNAAAQEVHREGVFIGSGTTDTKANVTTGGSLQVFTDPAQLDAFARLRVSNPETLFDSKQIQDNGALFWDDQEVSGSGTASSWTQDEASTTLSVSSQTAGRRVRQTFRRFNYQPGKSQLVILTGTLGVGGGTGIVRSMGLYDENNGIFVRDNEGTIEIVKRSSRDGSEIDTPVAQSSWNLDPMDGTGPSGITLDSTKSQIFFMDIEWLGVGRVRCGWFIDGLPVYCHQFLHSNNVAGVYMSTPNLPVRYEIENYGTGVLSELEAICCTVMSEGGTQDVGTSRYHSNAGTPIQASTAGTIYALVGIRLKPNNLGGIVKLSDVSVANANSQDFEWLLVFNPTLGSTPTWTNLANSVVQTSVGEASDPSTTTVTNGTVIYGGYVKSSNSSGSASLALDTAQQLGSAIDGTPDEVWLCARPLAANADMYGAIEIKEIG